MEENSKHPKHVIGYDGSLEELAEAIGMMSYDQVAVFLKEIAANIEGQANVDLTKRRRKKLAKELYEVATHLRKAEDAMLSVWKLCEPHMAKNE